MPGESIRNEYKDPSIYIYMFLIGIESSFDAINISIRNSPWIRKNRVLFSNVFFKIT